MSNFGDNKEFGLIDKSNLRAKLTLGANNPKKREAGVYVNLNDGRDYAFGSFDVDLIPSIIEHLQGIYDGFKEKTTREKLLDLPSGSHFKDTRFTTSAEYVKLGSHFFRVSDGMELPITNWTSSYEFEVIK